jgi:glycosyltransferase involved in cell wall biosynthesis
MPIRITAAICTHNRVALLPAAMESLLAQSLRPTDYEVLVIDNGSTDATPAVIRRYLDAPGAVTLRSAAQPLLGLSHARNLAADMAAGEIIAYLDDDAVADPAWLAALLDAYAAFPDAWAAGGPVRLAWQTPRPEWLGDDLLPMLSRLDLGEERRPIGTREYVWGTSLSCHRQAFRSLGLFRADLGRRGAALVSGEDTEFQRRIRAANRQVIYAPAAQVAHWVVPARARQRYFVARAYGKGRTRALVDAGQHDRAALRRKAWCQLASAGKSGLGRIAHWGDPAVRLHSLMAIALAAGYWREFVEGRGHEPY